MRLQSWTAATNALVLLAILLRLGVGLHTYSGHNHPPKFGDYEAQRHWMEVAVHLPPSEWYVYSTANDLSWWGLDYPPLSGFQSWLHGRWMQRMEPESVALLSSRGYESPSSKLLMRMAVLSSDLLVYIPAALWAGRVFGSRFGNDRGAFLTRAALLLNPSLLLVDHGHFQFNGISLGLAISGAAAGAERMYGLCAVLFSLALNHKQMSLFYAPAFFCFLLGSAMAQPTTRGKLCTFGRVALCTLGTFLVVWWPFLAAPGPLAVLRRVFPTQRGLFEDYVANFWCVTHPLFRWKHHFSASTLGLLASGSSLALAFATASLALRRPSAASLALSMTNSALACFLLGYQVHEKSILLPLQAILLLTARHPLLALTAALVAPFSMFPLLHRDGLDAAYLGCFLVAAGGALGLAACLEQLAPSNGSSVENSTLNFAPPNSFASSCSRAAHWLQTLPTSASVAVGLTLFLGCAALHVCSILFPPPVLLPWLWDALFMAWSFGVVAVIFACTIVLQVAEAIAHKFHRA